jgi:hypothetical protein
MMPTVAVLRACSGRPGSALPGQGANEPIGAFDHPGSRYAPILDGTDLEGPVGARHCGERSAPF